MNWRNKLEDVDGLSSEVVSDKNIAWEKLYSRIQQKTVRMNSRVWYQLAVACIIAAIIIPFLMIDKNPAKQIRNNPIGQSQKTAPPDFSLTTVNENTSQFPLNNKKQAHQLPLKNNVVNKKHRSPRIEKTAIATSVPVLEENTIPVTSFSSPILSTSTVAQVKKKLPVVHINELGISGDDPSNMARYYEHRAFQLKFINQQVYTTSSPGRGFNILKSKINPSN
ncbi:MAG: hypothetical protein ABJA57_04485 [Ginsengibacter sp.]